MSLHGCLRCLKYLVFALNFTIWVSFTRINKSNFECCNKSDKLCLELCCFVWHQGWVLKFSRALIEFVFCYRLILFMMNLKFNVARQLLFKYLIWESLLICYLKFSPWWQLHKLFFNPVLQVKSRLNQFSISWILLHDRSEWFLLCCLWCSLK